jgi:predicted Na+-dependent transporter
MEMQDMEGSTSDTSGFFSAGKKAEHYTDPYAESLLGYYKALNMEESAMKAMLLIAPVGLIAVFYVFVSQSTSSLISFSAWIFSVVFIIIAIGMLCEILQKDCGPRSMQDVAEVIREGSEGFFVTQYGTIFKYAFLTSIGLFIMYAMREIPS